MATFAHVMRTRSFSQAARDLELSKSAVSKRIAGLEERLGLRLLHRSTRQVAPTEAGETFFERCNSLLDEAEAAMRIAAEQLDEAQGLLRVNGPVLFGQLHLAPLIAPLLARFPALRVELTLTDDFIDPIADRQDVTIRIARLDDSSLVARKICEDRRFVCASPAYLARSGAPATPMDLTGHDCIRYSRMTLRDEWRFRRPAGARAKDDPGEGSREDPADARRDDRRDDEFSVPVVGRFASDDGSAMLQAVHAGAGIARLPGFMVADAIRRGDLISLLDEWIPRGHGIYAIHGHQRHVPPKVRVFLEALLDRFRGPSGGAPT